MTNSQNPLRAHELKLIDPIDEILLTTLNATADMPKGRIMDLIKEHLCRRGKTCALCGKNFNRRGLIIDRRKPISHGGKDNIENLQLLCFSCSALKGNNTMLQVRKKQRSAKTERQTVRSR